MNNRTLMIDDMRIPTFPEHFTLVTNTDDALRILKSDRNWGYIYLDHDLGEDAEGNTLDIWPVIKWLEKNRVEMRAEATMVLVSSNPAGVDRMKAALENAGFFTVTVREQDKKMLFHFRDWVND